MKIKPALILYLLLLLSSVYRANAQQNLGVTGTITEDNGQTTIPGASISIDKKGIGTSANKNGAFILLIPAANLKDTLRVSCIGYQTVFLPINAIPSNHELRITLKQNNVDLQEVNVAYYDAMKIIKKAISRIPDNYIDEPHITRGFYRLYTANGDNPLELSEAVFDVYNFGYTDKRADMLKLVKARDKKNLRDFSSFDVGLKPNTIFNYDVINHIASSGFLNDSGIIKHQFVVKHIVDVRGYPAYEVTFKEHDDGANETFSGKFYIDTKTYAFVYFDYGLSPTALRNGWAGIFAGEILKTREDVKLEIGKDRRRVGYQKVGDKWVLSDVSGDAALKIVFAEKKPDLAVNVKFNYQVTAVDSAPKDNFKGTLGRGENINDHESNTGDSFWGNYNILLSDFKTEDVFKKILAINEELKGKK